MKNVRECRRRLIQQGALAVWQRDEFAAHDIKPKLCSNSVDGLQLRLLHIGPLESSQRDDPSRLFEPGGSDNVGAAA